MPGFDQAVSSSAPRAPAPFAEREEHSGTFPRSQSREEKTLSAQVWGVGLAAGLPKKLSRNGIVAVPGDAARIGEFLARLYPSLREDPASAVRAPEMIAAKREFLGQLCDRIELRHDGVTVGVLVGAPIDWSSYYVRVYALAPAYQGFALTRRFSRECLFEPLRARNVQRVEAESSPSNAAMSRMLMKLQFHVTGQQLSERWGPLVRFTKFLDPACEVAFHKRFAGTAPPDCLGDENRKEDSP